MSSDKTRVADFLRITSRLIAVLEEEIGMLRAMKPSRMQELQQDKIVLAAAYESSLQALRKAPGQLADMSPALRSQLREISARVHEVLHENERALRAARQAADGLLSHMVAEVERQRGLTAGYSASGTVASIAGRTAAGHMAVAVDQRL